MDIDYPLLLSVATLVTGAVWLLDRPWLRQRRWTVSLIGDAGEAKPQWVEYSVAFFPVLAAVLVLRSFVFEPFQIPSSSMAPTLRAGDFVAVDKYSYGLRLPVFGTRVVPVGLPKRGDVMVFFPPGDVRYFIKRVVGLPGDRVELRDRVLRVNGQPVPRATLAVSLIERAEGWERYAETLGERAYQVRYHRRAPRSAFAVTVRSGHYFLMGDNRDNSRDSREWGQVPEANIVGRAVAIWMHWDDFLSWPSMSRNAWIR